MYLYKRIAVTNREIFFESHREVCRHGDYDAYAEYLTELAAVTDIIILREKDLNNDEYKDLAEKLFKALKLSKGRKGEIILHSHIKAAIQMNYKKIHLPIHIFQENLELLKGFEVTGVSVHSLEEACFAEANGAHYVVASHIFQTECKKDLTPKGLDFLTNICENIKIPVYALGGITKENELDTIYAGAFGACRMSDYMKGI